MPDPIIINGKKYITSKQGASLTGYARDYIGQLVRMGKVEGKVVEKTLFVSQDSLLAHLESRNGNTKVLENSLKSAIAENVVLAQTPKKTSVAIKDSNTFLPKLNKVNKVSTSVAEPTQQSVPKLVSKFKTQVSTSDTVSKIVPFTDAIGKITSFTLKHAIGFAVVLGILSTSYASIHNPDSFVKNVSAIFDSSKIENLDSNDQANVLASFNNVAKKINKDVNDFFGIGKGGETTIVQLPSKVMTATSTIVREIVRDIGTTTIVRYNNPPAIVSSPVVINNSAKIDALSADFESYKIFQAKQIDKVFDSRSSSTGDTTTIINNNAEGTTTLTNLTVSNTSTSTIPTLKVTSSLTLNGDTITSLVGSGLELSNGVLSATAGAGFSTTSSDFHFDSRLAATTTLNNITTLRGLTDLITTNATTTSLAIGSDYITDLTGSNLSVVNGALTVTLDGAFSTTSTNYWETTQTRWATTSDSYAFDTRLAATTTLNNITTLRGLTDLITTNATTTSLAIGSDYITDLTGTNLSIVNGALTSADLTFSTTSANYWETLQTRWSSTSAAYYLAQNQGNAFSTTSATYWDSTLSRWATTSDSYAFDTRLAATTTLNNITTLRGLTDLITTNATTTSLAIGSDYITDLTGSNLSVVNGALTVTLDGAFSTTSANYWETLQTRWATTSDSYAFDTRLAATTTLNNITTLRGLTDTITTRATTTNATSTSLYVTTLGVGSDYITDLTGTNLSIVNGALTSADLTFSTTSADYWETTQTRWATTSSTYFLSTKSTSDLAEGSNLYFTNNRFDTRLAATTTLNNITTLGSLSLPLTQTTGTLSVSRGGTGQTSFGQGWLSSDGTTLTSSTSPTVAYITATSTTATSTFPNLSTTNIAIGSDYITDLTGSNLSVVNGALTVTLDGAFSTTSADYWETTQTRWATTSDSYAFDTRLAATTTLNNITTLRGLTDTITTRATTTNATSTNFFATTASSTNLFSSSLTVGSNALVVTSAGNVGVGTNSPGTNGLTLGDTTSTGNYVRVLGSDAENTYAVFSGERKYPRFDLVDTFAGGSTFSFWNLGNTMRFGTNTGTAANAAWYTKSGNAGDVIFNGKIGIGTTSPYAKLSVVGQTVSEYFTATSTTATSTFPLLSSTAFALGSDYITDLTGTNLSIVNGALTATDLAFSTTSTNYWETTQTRWDTTSDSDAFDTRLVATTSLPNLTQIGTQSSFAFGNATGSSLYLTSLDCSLYSNGGKLTTDSSGMVSCANDNSGVGGGGGSDVNWTFFNTSGISVSTTTNQVVIGASATSSLQKLQVSGGVYVIGNIGIGTTSPYESLSVNGNAVINGFVQSSYFTATSTTATSTFPNLSTTNIAIGSDYITDLTGSNLSVVNGALTVTLDGAFSTTSTNYWETTQTRWATTSDSYAFDTRLAATTTLNNITTLRGLTDLITTNATTTSLAIGSDYITDLTGTNLSVVNGALTVTLDGAFSTTSADYWETTQTRWATTSSAYFLSTKSTSDLAEGSNLYFTNNRFDTRLAATTSLPNLNILGGLASIGSTTGTTTVLGGAIFNSNVGIGTTSPSAQFSISGTGAYIDTAGNVPFGNSSLYVRNTGSSGTYAQIKTESATGVNFLVTNAGNVAIGNSSPEGKLQILKTGTFSLTDSTTASQVFENGDGLTVGYTGGMSWITRNGTLTQGAFISAYNEDGSGSMGLSFGTRVGGGTLTERFSIKSSGNVGIGTTSPYAKLSVVGQVVGQYFTATSTTATSTFPNLSTTNIAIGSDYITDITGSNLSIVNGALTVTLDGAFSTTSADYWETTQTRWATTSDSYAFDTRLAATTTLNNITTLRGLTDTITTRATTTNATSTNFFATTASSTNLFSSALTVGSNALIVTSAGNVGVGTSTPNTKLTVTSFGANGINIDTDTSSPTISGRLFFSNSTTGQSLALFNSAGSLSFRTLATVGTNSGTERMIISSAGNLGIGTSTPYAKLSVVGQTVSEYFTATSTTATSTFPLLSTNALSLNGTYVTSLWATTSDSYAFDTRLAATTTLNNITTLGGLSLPITQTTGTLSVSRGGTGQTSFGQGWLHSDGTTLTSSTSPTVAYITATSTTATSTFPLLSTNALSLNGQYYTSLWSTTSDSYAFDTRLAATTTLNNITTLRGLTDIISTRATTTNATSTNFFATTASSTNLFSSALTVGSNALVVNSAGNVGVGTTSPASKLHIEGTNSVTGGLSIYSTAGTANGRLAIYPTGNTSVAFQKLSSNGVVSFLNSSGSEEFRIAADGNIGIGTTSPYAKLSVVGQTVSEYFTATSTTATSTFPNLSLTNVRIGSDYITDITGSNLSIVNGALTATDLTFSTTSADYWETTQTRWATTSDSYAFDTRLAATTTLNNITTLGGLSLPITQTTGTLSVSRGGTGQTSFGQGWLHSDGTTLTSSTSPTVAYITATSTATSTFGGGINVSGAGCFAINGSCIGGGSGLFGSGAANKVAYWTGSGNLSYSNAFGWNGTTGQLTAPTLEATASSSILKLSDTTILKADLTLGNFFAGESAGNTTPTGQYNTAVGLYAMTALTSGNGNSAFGRGALSSVTDGINNVGMGYNAGVFIDTGSGNVAIGTNSLSNVSGGGNNTALGTNAGAGIVSGSNNLLLGYDADVLSSSLTNASAIGYNAKVAISDAIVLGTSGMKIGIGTSTPFTTLSVNGQAAANYFTAVSTTATSTFPLLSSTAFALGSDYITDLTGSNLSVVNGALTVTLDGAFSTTSADYWETTQTRWATTSSAYFLSVNQGNAFSTTSATYWDSTLSRWATTSDSYAFDTRLAATTTLNNLNILGGLASIGSTTGTTTFAGGTVFNGLVGIGTTTPGTKLEVTGGDITIGYQQIYGIRNSVASIVPFATVNNGTIGPNASKVNTFRMAYGNANGWEIGNTQVGIAGSLAAGAANVISFQTNTTERMRIDSSGNLGIGTTSPYAKLSVVGQTVSEYFTATSTTATSTFPLLSTNALSLNGQYYTSLWSTTSDSYAFDTRLAATTTLNNLNTLGGLATVGSTTGTTNFFGTSIFNGKVGVGTTTPVSELTVANSSGVGSVSLGSVYATSAAYAGITLNGSPAGNSYNFLSSPTDTNLYINRPTGKSILFRESNGSQMVLLTGGNVGIGTTTPYAKLSVAGQTVSEYFTATSTTATSTFPLLSTNALSLNGQYYTSLWSTTSDSYAFDTRLAATTTLNNLNTLGGLASIGSTTGTTTFLGDAIFSRNVSASDGTAAAPSYIFSSAPTTGMFLSGSGVGLSYSGVARLYANGSGVQVAGALTPTTDDTRALGTGSFRWNSLSVGTGVSSFAGNVGIGTTSPYAKLSVVGQTVSEYFTATSTTATSTFPLLSTNALSLNGQYYTSLWSTTSDSYAFDTRLAATTTLNNLNTLGGLASIGSTTGTTTFLGATIFNGFVGIGVTNPTEQLEIADTLKVNNEIHIGGAGSAGDASLYFNNDTNTGLFSPGADSFGISTGGIERMRFDAGGKVGIGTTTPYAKLSVVGQTVAEYFTATSTTATSTFPNLSLTNLAFGSDYITDITGSNLSIVNGALTATDLTFSTTSADYWETLQTRWATTSDSYAFDTRLAATTTLNNLNILGGLASIGSTTGTTTVLGGAVFNGRIGVGTSSPSAQFSISGTGAYIDTASNVPFGDSSLYVRNTGSSGTFAQIKTESATGVNFLVTNAGNVAIGNSSPEGKLQILKTGTFSLTDSTTASQVFENGDGLTVGYTGGMSWIVRNAALTQGAFISANNEDGSGSMGLAFGTRVSGGTLTERFSIKSSGNIGIGTTSPYAKLSVVGETVAEYFTATSTTATSTFPLLSTNALSLNGQYYTSLWSTTSDSYAFDTRLAATTTLNNLTTLRGLTDIISTRATTTNATSTNFYATTASTTNLFVGGSIGIGTSSPSAAVEIYNTNSSVSLAIDGNAGGIDIARIYRGQAGSGTGWGAAWSVASNNPQMKFLSGASSQNAGTIVSTMGYDSTGGGFFIATSSVNTGLRGVEPFFIKASTGYVGLGGTTTPWRTVSIKGTFGIDGLTTAAGTPSSICMNAATKEITVNAATSCVVSDRDQKQDIQPLTVNGLDALNAIKAVTFAYNDIPGRSRIGFIAQDLQGVDNRLGDAFDKDGIARSIDIPAIMSITVKAVQELDTKVNDQASSTASQFLSALNIKPTTADNFLVNGDLKFKNDFSIKGDDMKYLYLKSNTGDTVMTFADNGNIGIGTTTPAYKLQIAGDIAATAFVNVSTREAKKNINYLDDNAKMDALEALSKIKIANYRYKTDSDSDPLRLGLIAEEAPASVLSASGKGVDLYKLTTFTLAAVQAQQKKIENIDTRLSALEAKVASSTPAVSEGLIASVISAIKDLSLNKLEIGSQSKPSGITLFDEESGEPYCIKMSGGAMKSTPGVCGTVAVEEEPAPAVVSQPTQPTQPIAPAPVPQNNATTTTPVATTTPAVVPPTVQASSTPSTPVVEAPKVEEKAPEVTPAPTTAPEAPKTEEPKEVTTPVVAPTPAPEPAAPVASIPALTPAPVTP